MLKLKLLLISLSLLLFGGCADNGAYIINETIPTTITTSQGEPIINNITNAIPTESILLKIGVGEIDGYSVVHKFGSGELTTTFSVISQTGNYQTPSTPQSLEFVSNNVQDTSTGTGAREITFDIINSSWQREIITIVPNGTTPVQLPKQV